MSTLEVTPPQPEVQRRAIDLVARTLADYTRLNQGYRERMLDIYEAFSTYKEKKRADWSTTFKVNKAHEIVEKILPRIIAKSPRWIVTPRIDNFYKDKKLVGPDGQELIDDGSPEAKQAIFMARKARLDKANELCRGIQDYLSYIFDEYNLEQLTRLWAKDMIVYGKGRAKIKFKYEVVRGFEDTVEKDENGKDVKKKKIKEDVSGEYPTIDVKSWTDVYTDPRYRLVRDMPAYIEKIGRVRLADLKRKEDEYFNLDKIASLPEPKEFGENADAYKQKVAAIAGITCDDVKAAVDKNALDLNVYYGYFQESEDAEEKMYKITVASGIILIGYKEISEIPFEEIDCFEDTETNFATGFVEPIIGLTDELNFKKNSASEFINHGLNRSFVWSASSGIDPRDLVSRPGNIIPTTESNAEVAMKGLVELPHREINASYFQEQNDLERQIQAATFTVDTANQQNQQALTNTATGIRVKFFESNSVIDEVRKHFEQGLVRLAYKLLLATFENMDDNIVFKKTGEEGFWEMNKEALKDAIIRYSIKVEANSSSFNDVESRREDAIALGEILMKYKDAGANVNLDESLIDIVESGFERKDVSKYIMPPDINQIVDGVSAMGGGGSSLPRPEASAGATPAAALTQQVAQGNITSTVQ